MSQNISSRTPIARRPSVVFAERLRSVRKQKEWNQQQLAEAMTSLGYPMARSQIAKLEGGNRNVLLDEVFAFSAALGVSPSALMLARDPMDDEGVQITPIRYATSWLAWSWFRGLEPLRVDDDDERFFFDQLPTIEAHAMRRVPWLREQMNAIWHLIRLAGSDSDYAENIDRARERVSLNAVLHKTLTLNSRTEQIREEKKNEDQKPATPAARRKGQ